MPKIRDVIKLVEDAGWVLDHQTGSHWQFKHPTRPGIVTISGHPGDDVHPKTLNSILKQAGLQRK